ncbi:MAG: MarR family transcriptional regulator [Bradyrhizobiaceae bacterium]|nr:MarR family transcriptional regulator [Bradyrhizobiaceae bacterium]
MKPSLDHEYLFLLHEVAHLMRTRADRRARIGGMTRAQWVILLHLDRTPGLSQNELASLLEVEPITVGRLVDRLEARGVVERCPNPKDRRAWRLHLTPKAAPILQQIENYRSELHTLITAGINKSTLNTLKAGLLKMKANLAAEEGADARQKSKAAG